MTNSSVEVFDRYSSGTMSSTLVIQSESAPLEIALPGSDSMSDEEFYRFCCANRELRIERQSSGEIVIMPPTGGETGRRNVDILFQLESWNRQQGNGVAFDSSTGFKLPNGANRSPDASWIPQAQWDALNDSERAGFIPVCPTFVVELRSPSDRLDNLQTKLAEYIENGTQLGWLIDPAQGRVYVYEPKREVEILEGVAAVSGDPVLSGFELELEEIF